MATNPNLLVPTVPAGERLARRLCFDLRRNIENYTRLFDDATRLDDDELKLEANGARRTIEQIRDNLTTITDVSNRQRDSNRETLQIAHDLLTCYMPFVVRDVVTGDQVASASVNQGTSPFFGSQTVERSASTPFPHIETNANVQPAARPESAPQTMLDQRPAACSAVALRTDPVDRRTATHLETETDPCSAARPAAPVHHDPVDHCHADPVNRTSTFTPMPRTRVSPTSSISSRHQDLAAAEIDRRGRELSEMHELERERDRVVREKNQKELERKRKELEQQMEMIFK